MAFIGQYLTHTPHSMQASVISAFPLTLIASVLQNVAHWAHPTQV